MTPGKWALVVSVEKINGDVEDQHFHIASDLGLGFSWVAPSGAGVLELPVGSDHLFTITRTSGTTRKWTIRGQDEGITRYLSEFTPGVEAA